MDAFTAYYNHGHRHSGTGLHTTPASVHFGTAEQVRDQRTVALTVGHTAERAETAGTSDGWRVSAR
ncbi:hypothetical protein ACIOWG_23695 [Streptomyces sp. NPDC087658]|uniref:hypothetical protein n=1 Tax=Streptomyces sp. NPDC087658 TaxID=3365800 RepID=UPI003801C441